MFTEVILKAAQDGWTVGELALHFQNVAYNLRIQFDNSDDVPDTLSVAVHIMVESLSTLIEGNPGISCAPACILL